jgi:dsDNA-specific endonuclease/ATPase MutS2
LFYLQRKAMWYNSLAQIATDLEAAPMAKLVLDLHDIYNRSDKIDSALNQIVQEAIEKRIALVEIIPGKGSGQLKKRVLRFLNQSHIRTLYHRIEKDDRNFGRIFIHFRH